MEDGLGWHTENKYYPQKLFPERILLKRNSSILPLRFHKIVGANSKVSFHLVTWKYISFSIV